MEFNLSSCERFNCPSEVKEYFKEILNLLKSYKAVSLILLGSAVEGKLIYEIKKNKIKVYSDYDMVIIIEKYDKRVKKLKESLLKLSYEMRKNSLGFNLDFKLITLKQLSNLPRHTYTYSLKNKGLLIWGKDVKKIIPSVSLNDIDIKEENESLIRVLLYVLYYMPKNIFDKNFEIESEEDSMKEFNFVICKYALQIVPWLLLLEGNLINSIDISECIHFIKTNYHALQFSNFMGDEFLKQLELFRKGNFYLKFEIGIRELYNYFVNCIFNAFRYLIYRKVSLYVDSENIGESLISNAYFLFNDRVMKVRIQNLFFLLRNLVSLKDYSIRVLYPFAFKRNAFIASMLLSLHFSIRDYLIGNKSYYRSLEFIKKYFGKNKFYFDEKNISFLMIKQLVINFIYAFSHYPWLPSMLENNTLLYKY